MTRNRPLTIAALSIGVAAFSAGAVLAAGSSDSVDPVWITGPVQVQGAGPTVLVYNPGTTPVDAQVEYVHDDGSVVPGGGNLSIPAGQTVATACGCPADTYVFRITAAGYVVPSALVPVPGNPDHQLDAGDFIYMGADGDSPTASTVGAIAALSASLDTRTQTVDGTTKSLESQNAALQSQVGQLKKQNKKILKKLKKLSH